MRAEISYLSSLITPKNTLAAAVILALAGMSYCYYKISKKDQSKHTRYNSGHEFKVIGSDEPSAFGSGDDNGGPLTNPKSEIQRVSSGIFTETSGGVVSVEQGKPPASPKK